MTVKVSALGAWIQTRNTLSTNLSSVLELLEGEPASEDPVSVYQKAEAQVDALLQDMRRLAVAGLRQLDDQVAAGTLVAELATLSKDARREADRQRDAVKTIQAVTKAVTAVSQVVTAITKLPFV